MAALVSISFLTLIISSILYLIYIGKNNQKFTSSYPASKKRIVFYLMVLLLHFPILSYSFSILQESSNLKNLGYQQKSYRKILSGYYFPTVVPSGYFLNQIPHYGDSQKSLPEIENLLTMSFGPQLLNKTQVVLKQSKQSADFSLNKLLLEKKLTETLEGKINPEELPSFFVDGYLYSSKMKDDYIVNMLYLATEDNNFILIFNLPSKSPPNLLEFAYNLKKVD